MNSNLEVREVWNSG